MSIKKIALTGGPCGGKTTAIPYIVELAESFGYQVIVIPEIATSMKLEGLTPDVMGRKAFQMEIARRQVEAEKFASSRAGSKELILCDRGLYDGKSYVTEEEFAEILINVDANSVKPYDAVFHLVTTAIGAPQYYTVENNKARTSSAERAMMLDKKTKDSWSDYQVKVIANNGTWEQKIDELLCAVAAIL